MANDIELANDTPLNARVSARETAFAIRRIALERNLLRLGSSVVPETNSDIYQMSATAFTAEVTDTLERQSVTAVGFNSKSNTVFIYTSKRVAKAQEKTLPFNISGSVNVLYRQLKPRNCSPGVVLGR